MLYPLRKLMSGEVGALSMPVLLSSVLAIQFLVPSVTKADEYDDLVSQADKAIVDKELDLAVACCNRAISIDPYAAGAYISRAWAYINRARYDEAISDCDQALDRNPSPELSSIAYNNRGVCHLEKGEYKLATADWSRALQADPGNHLAYANVSWLLATCPNAKLREGRKALEWAKKAYESDPEDGIIMQTLAAAYAECGDFEEAVHWMKKAMTATNKSTCAGESVEELGRRLLESFRQKKPWRLEKAE